MNLNEIEREALAILAAEARQAAVSQAAHRLRNRRSIWVRIRDALPFTITKRKPHVPH